MSLRLTEAVTEFPVNDTATTSEAVSTESTTVVKAKNPKAKPVAASKGKSVMPIVRGEMTEDGRRKTLRNPQIVLLTALSKSRTGTLTRKELMAKCPSVGLTEHLGSIMGEKNKYTVSLIEHKYVKQEQHDIDNKDVMVYSITASGRKALEKVNAK